MSFEQIFNADKLIDEGVISNILESYNGKKIIGFGGGTIAETLMKKVLGSYDVECFVDNNEKIWGKTICDKEIKSPDILKNYNKRDYVILILSQHVTEIKNQLENYGLKETIDYCNLFKPLLPYFRVTKFQRIVKKYKKFLDSIPEDIFDNISVKNNTLIGVVCEANMGGVRTWYAITVFLLLKCQGYNVTLIIDELKSFYEVTYFKGCTDIATLYVDFIINLLKNKFSSLDIRYLDEREKAELDDNDLIEVERLVNVNLKWLSPVPDIMLDYDRDNLRDVFYEILEDKMKVIKSFFSRNQFDTINVMTALERHSGLYMYEGIRHGMRVSNYDGFGVGGTTLVATDYPCTWSYDVRKMIKKKMLNNELNEKIVELAKEDFKARINSTKDVGDYNFQITTNVNENQQYYDVILPLNINCDGAALGVDRVFKSEREWIIKTIDFVLSNTNANIMIREHPAAISEYWKNYNLIGYEAEIQAKYRNNKRVFYCKSNDAINTYKMIEKCKVVLPYTSTVGIESVLLGKPVITHTNVYYAQLDFIYNAETEKDYFELLLHALKNELPSKTYDTKDAYIAYYGLRNLSLKTEFRDINEKWMEYSLKKLLNVEGVDKLLLTIAEDMPICYLNFLDL